jgi:Mycobacterial 4 TMS phage holin, superfamily IV
VRERTASTAVSNTGGGVAPQVVLDAIRGGLRGVGQPPHDRVVVGPSRDDRLTAPVSFGIAWFFVSLLMLVVTKAIVGGFHIHGFWTLVEATLIVWVVNLVLDFVPGPWQVTGKRRRRREQETG